MHNTKSSAFKAILGAAIAVAATTSATAAAPSFADCFKLKPGVAYRLSDRSRVQIIKTQFAGKAAMGVVSIDGGVKTVSFFDETGRQRLGSEQYGIAALGGNANEVAIKEVFATPFPEVPADVKPGAAFKLAGKGVKTTSAGNESFAFGTKYQADHVFVGFESLELTPNYKARTFENVCHVRSRGKDNSVDSWYAPEYGVIKMQVKTAKGDVFFSYELDGLEER
ncbi:hypothetical protein [Variovorax boronicumulans]|uniref:hypothetical protein n=1 Tax=Variovorax boronicumulans TaxID=436515 RepID=UPI0007849925|nr:hypothetical protein [Variovorax boronicumulans]